MPDAQSLQGVMPKPTSLTLPRLLILPPTAPALATQLQASPSGRHFHVSMSRAGLAPPQILTPAFPLLILIHGITHFLAAETWKFGLALYISSSIKYQFCLRKAPSKPTSLACKLLQHRSFLISAERPRSRILEIFPLHDSRKSS